MQTYIEHKGKKYEIIRSYIVSELTFECLPSLLELGWIKEVETKPDGSQIGFGPTGFIQNPDGTVTYYGPGYEHETKPEEKPIYWYIETSEMKKSEYWEVFAEWFIEKIGFIDTKPEDLSAEFYGYSKHPKGNGYDWSGFGGVGKENMTLLSPQQWYDTIYDGEKPDHDKAIEKPTEECECEGWRQIHRKDGYLFCAICDKRIIGNHDKAIEIAEVPEYKKIWDDDTTDIQLELLTNSLNLLIKAHNNK